MFEDGLRMRVLQAGSRCCRGVCNKPISKGKLEAGLCVSISPSPDLKDFKTLQSIDTFA